MKVIVGLGNPGAKYRGTRHNIGFAIVDEVVRRAGVEFEGAPVDALIAKIRGAEPVLVAKPLTFMNESGRAIGELTRYFRIELAELLVVVDEVQLPLAKLRARPRGSAGGHNGLKSIIEYLGTDFSRLRVGVGRGDSRRGLADHVLARFDPEERPGIEAAIARAADAVLMWTDDGLEKTMNVFNRAEDETK